MQGFARWGSRAYAAGAAGIVAYFAAAFYLDRSYVDPRPKGAVVVRLTPPFERSGFAAVARNPKLDRLAACADDEHVEDDRTSSVIVYEDSSPLAGAAHSTFADIAGLGGGRFAHWRSATAFSASDNSDPNRNGRRYWAVLPERREDNGGGTDYRADCLSLAADDPT